MAEQAPLSRERIESSITNSLNRQEVLTDQYRTDVDASAAAEADFKEWFAKERLIARTAAHYEGVKMGDKMAEDIATVKTAEKRTKMLLTAASESATRQALMSVRERIEALRTLNTNHREIS